MNNIKRFLELSIIDCSTELKKSTLTEETRIFLNVQRDTYLEIKIAIEKEEDGQLAELNNLYAAVLQNNGTQRYQGTTDVQHFQSIFPTTINE